MFRAVRTVANVLLHHIGAYEDDRGQAIEAFTTWDANIRIDAGSLFGEASGCGDHLWRRQYRRCCAALCQCRRQLRSALSGSARSAGFPQTGTAISGHRGLKASRLNSGTVWPRSQRMVRITVGGSPSSTSINPLERSMAEITSIRDSLKTLAARAEALRGYL